ncbi:proteasome ATPase [Candidatus Saccharibacteria bacterium]|nr:proteasome ATPase [Candidatus Saccharibacteria bacterium]
MNENDELQPSGQESESRDAEVARLRNALRESRQQLLALRDEVDRMAEPPLSYALYLCSNNDGTVDVVTAGSGAKRMTVTVSPTVDRDLLRTGCLVKVNQALAIVAVAGFSRTGELCTLKEVLARESGEPQRVMVVSKADDTQVVWVADSIRPSDLKIGDTLLVDTREGFVFERVPKSDAEQLVLEEVPDISYEDIGGLGPQIEQIRDAVELPYLHADLFTEFKLKPPKGVLLYGPPGCGKTLIAKAVANSLAKKVAEMTGDKNAKAYFLNIKGPELLNKYVGETERHIREIFGRAREKAAEGMPVIVFFDEMESLFRTRGSGVSSDMESTIVPQLLSEIDGVEGLENVLVIGASNRQDMIDPAVLRPGRLDVKIRVERPGKEAAADIFSKYLTADLPIDADEIRASGGGDRDKCVARLIERTVERMYAESTENEFLEVTYQSGVTKKLYFKDFNSGAMTENIVNRAKKAAIKEVIAGGTKGLRQQHLIDAIVDEFKENEDLPNTTNPDDWARISGEQGEKITFVKTLISRKAQAAQPVEDYVPRGQYL